MFSLARPRFVFSAFCAMLIPLFSAADFASTGKTIHSFSYLSNGANPQSNLISDSAGNLYGTTYFGGSKGLGEVFQLSPKGDGTYTQTTLYSFAGGANDGSYPSAGVVMEADGNLYGTTGGGGSSTFCGSSGCGAVYKLTRTSVGWSESILFFFTGTSTGVIPTAGVVLDSAGNLYGAAGSNGYSSYGYGVLFKLIPSAPFWTETVLHNFDGSQTGGFPLNTPVLDSTGNLYGSIEGATGDFYGVAYQLSPGTSGWTYTVLHEFQGYPSDVGTPSGAMIFDSAGNLYGAAAGGGSCGSDGAVFELSPSSGGSWTEKELTCFEGANGQVPQGQIAFDSAGNIYGSTFEGGAYGFGTVFQLTPALNGHWNSHVIKNFTNGADGATPKGGVVFDPAGYLYVAGYSGDSPACLYANYGNGGCGSVIRMTPRTSGPWPSKTISHFSATDSAFPMGGLIADSEGNFYGTATQGGVYGAGQVFKFSQSNGVWTKTVLHDFSGNVTGTNSDGLYPSGNLIFDSAGKLYGTTQMGGGNDYCLNFAPGCGIVFELSPTATGPWTEKILYTFSAAVGGVPTSGLVFDTAGNLYGTTQQGGLNYCGMGPCGMVYKLSPASGGTWTETTLYQFTGGNDGGNPGGSVVLDSAGNIYGTTNNSGLYQLGTAFELSPSGNSWTFHVIHAFGEKTSDPYYPQSGLIADSSGNLYGTAYGPTGVGNDGNVYQLSLVNGHWNVSVLHVFKRKEGSNPVAGVTLGANGVLYGTTMNGGESLNCTDGCGVVFSLTPSSSGWTESTLYSFTGKGDGAAPMASVAVDSNGNVFATTSAGGGGRQGTVFEVMP